MRQDYDIVGSYDNQRVSTISAERTVNMFEYMDEDGKRPKVLLSTSGLRNANLDLEDETGGSRAELVFKGSIYSVYGKSVFQTTGTTGSLMTIKIGEITPGLSGYVGIDANTFQVIIVDGQGGWIWDTSNPAAVLEPITDPAFPIRPIDVCYLDGFFVVANGLTNQFQLSMFDQGLIWGPDAATIAGNTFTLAAGASNVTLTSGSSLNYQVGTPVVFAGGGLPIELVAGTTYYVVAVVSPTIIQVSATNNGTAITSAGGGNGTVANSGQLQQGEITSHPGSIVACRTLHRRLFLFSQNFTEVWENAGIGTNLPFRRNNALLMEVGTPAIGSIAIGFDRMFFLSQDRDGLGSVMEVMGTESVPVSNRALDYQLAQYASDPDTGVADARGIMIKENGIMFYRLNFTLANHTFVLNITMSKPDDVKWHEEEVLNGDRHPAQTHVYYGGMNYYGHYSEPIFYEVDDLFVTNDGEPIRRMRIGRQITPVGYARLRIDRWQVDVLQGKVDQTTIDELNLDAENTQDILTEDSENILTDQQLIGFSAEPPKIFLSISKDGGQSYGYSTSSNMGRIGQRTFRTVWRKLGTTPRGQGYTPKIEFFNQVPFVVLGAMWDFEVMPE